MRKTLLILLICFVTVALLVRLRAASARAAERPHSPNVPAAADLDTQAARAHTSGDETSIRDLTDAVFRPFGWANRQEIRGRVQERIVRAELSFRARQTQPIQMEAVVRMVNDTAHRLSAPFYVQTNMEQVRYLRTALMIRTPHLVGPSARQGNESQIPGSMSPVEATYLALSLIHQKLFNPVY
jgi:hypothetical protein